MVSRNRSMPDSTVIPVLNYPDVSAAVDWLCGAFGFTLRWQAGGHRAQLNVGQDGAIVLAQGSAGAEGHSVMVRIEDADAHCQNARTLGAEILAEPLDYAYGERQYTARDLAGHIWTFSQTVADRAPEDWGGTSSNV